jgi:hypothetical protein
MPGHKRRRGRETPEPQEIIESQESSEDDLSERERRVWDAFKEEQYEGQCDWFHSTQAVVTIPSYRTTASYTASAIFIVGRVGSPCFRYAEELRLLLCHS